MPEYLNQRQITAGIITCVILMVGCCVDLYLQRVRKKHRATWLRGLARLNRRPWDFYDGIYILLVMAAFTAGMILIAQIIDHFDIMLSPMAEKVLVLVETLLMQLAGFAAIEKLRRDHSCTYRQAFSTKGMTLPKAIGLAILFYLAIIPLVFMAAAIVNPILTILHIPLEPQTVIQEFVEPDVPNWIRYGLISLAVATAPMVEELFFRGVALPIASKYASPTMAIIAVSTAFALIHANIAAIAPLFTFSVGLCLAYIYTGSILVPMLMHSIFNTISLAILIFIAT